MNFWTICIALVCGIAIAQSVFLGGYMLAKDRMRSKPVLFLSLLLFALALRIGKSYFFYVLPHVPNWGVAIGGAGLWAVGPSLWLYTKSAMPAKIKWLDYCHFLPSILILISGYFLPISWLVSAYHIGSGILAVYVLASGWIFWKRNWSGNHKRFKLFWGSMAVICATFLFQMWAGGIASYTIGSAIACFVLYGINFIILQDQSILKPPTKKSKKKKAPADLLPIANSIDHLFQKEKLYQQKGLTLAMVGERLGTPTYLISQAINQQYGKKFNEFVNGYRVAEVKQHLADLQTNQKIEVIASAVGFSSTASLYNAFKKEESLTPQAYRKQLTLTKAVKI